MYVYLLYYIRYGISYIVRVFERDETRYRIPEALQIGGKRDGGVRSNPERNGSILFKRIWPSIRADAADRHKLGNKMRMNGTLRNSLYL